MNISPTGPSLSTQNLPGIHIPPSNPTVNPGVSLGTQMSPTEMYDVETSTETLEQHLRDFTRTYYETKDLLAEAEYLLQQEQGVNTSLKTQVARTMKVIEQALDGILPGTNWRELIVRERTYIHPDGTEQKIPFSLADQLQSIFINLQSDPARLKQFFAVLLDLTNKMKEVQDMATQTSPFEGPSYFAPHPENIGVWPINTNVPTQTGPSSGSSMDIVNSPSPRSASSGGAPMDVDSPNSVEYLGVVEGPRRRPSGYVSPVSPTTRPRPPPIRTTNLPPSRQSSVRARGVRSENRSAPRPRDNLPSPKTREQKRRLAGQNVTNLVNQYEEL